MTTEYQVNCSDKHRDFIYKTPLINNSDEFRRRKQEFIKKYLITINSI